MTNQREPDTQPLELPKGQKPGPGESDAGFWEEALDNEGDDDFIAFIKSGQHLKQTSPQGELPPPPPGAVMNPDELRDRE